MSGTEANVGVKRKNRWPVIFVVFVVVFIAVFLLWKTVFESGPATGSVESAAVSAQVERPQAGTRIDPERLYAANCALCHGDNLQGKGSIPTLHSPKWNYAGKDDELVKVIYQGKGKRMPGFSGRLSNAQIEAIAAWLQEQNATATKTSPEK